MSSYLTPTSMLRSTDRREAKPQTTYNPIVLPKPTAYRLSLTMLQSMSTATASASTSATVNGIKRTADRAVKDANPTPASTSTNINTNTSANGNDTSPTIPFREQMIKKLLSNMRVYTNNIINESNNINVSPDKAALIIGYEGQKMAIAVQTLEGMLIGSDGGKTAQLQRIARQPQQMLTPIPAGAEATTPQEDARIEEVVKRVLEPKLSLMKEAVAESVFDDVWEILDNTVGDVVEECWCDHRAAFESDVRDAVVVEVMDDDMKEVKEAVMLEIKARKVLGDVQDSQDQLRALGDILD